MVRWSSGMWILFLVNEWMRNILLCNMKKILWRRKKKRAPHVFSSCRGPQEILGMRSPPLKSFQYKQEKGTWYKIYFLYEILYREEERKNPEIIMHPTKIIIFVFWYKKYKTFFGMHPASMQYFIFFTCMYYLHV